MIFSFCDAFTPELVNRRRLSWQFTKGRTSLCVSLPTGFGKSTFAFRSSPLCLLAGRLACWWLAGRLACWWLAGRLACWWLAGRLACWWLAGRGAPVAPFRSNSGFYATASCDCPLIVLSPKSQA